MAENDNQKHQQHLTPAFVYATFGNDVLALLRKDKTNRVFPFEIFDKIHTQKESFESDAEYKEGVVTPVMEAFLAKAYSPAKDKPQIAQWIFKQYLSHKHNSEPIKAEDLYKIGDNISYFDTLKKSGPFKETGASANLLGYKTYAEFEAMLDPHLKRKAQKELLAEVFNMTPQQKEKLLEETTILYDGPEGRVVVPHTTAASQYWGSNTKWCIAGRNGADQMFPHYNAQSPVIMLLPKGQSDNKVALVDHILYDSEDDTIPALPVLHDKLMQSCLDGLSDGARKGVTPWLPKKADPVAANDPAPIDTALQKAVKKELRKLEGWGAKKDPALWSQREFVLAAVRQDGRMLQYAAKALTHDREIVLAAALMDGNALSWAAKELRGDSELVLAVVRQHGYALQYATEELKRDPKVVFAAVQQDGRALHYAADELKHDREIVLAAVRQNGYALHYAADELKQNYEIVLAAVRQYSRALCSAEGLKRDSGFVTRLLEEIDNLPFEINSITDKDIWRPDDAALARYQVKALERMVERGDIESFFKYSRHMKATWGDPDTLFVADPAVTLEKIKAKVAAQYPAKRDPAARAAGMAL